MKNLGIDEMHSELFSRMNQLEVEFHTEIEKTRNRENEILSRIDRMTKTSGAVQFTFQKHFKDVRVGCVCPMVVSILPIRNSYQMSHLK